MEAEIGCPSGNKNQTAEEHNDNEDIDATKHTRTEPFQFLGACYAQVVCYVFMLSLSVFLQ